MNPTGSPRRVRAARSLSRYSRRSSSFTLDGVDLGESASNLLCFSHMNIDEKGEVVSQRIAMNPATREALQCPLHLGTSPSLKSSQLDANALPKGDMPTGERSSFKVSCEAKLEFELEFEEGDDAEERGISLASNAGGEPSTCAPPTHCKAFPSEQSGWDTSATASLSHHDSGSSHEWGYSYERKQPPASFGPLTPAEPTFAQQCPFEGRHCSEPMKWARQKVEVFPGHFVSMCGSEETWNAFCRKAVLDTSCAACATFMFCIDSASMVLCPSCRSISPIEGGQSEYLGLGLTVQVASEQIQRLASKS
jgi:hypothetical protein